MQGAVFAFYKVRAGRPWLPAPMTSGCRLGWPSAMIVLSSHIGDGGRDTCESSEPRVSVNGNGQSHSSHVNPGRTGPGPSFGCGSTLAAAVCGLVLSGGRLGELRPVFPLLCVWSEAARRSRYACDVGRLGLSAFPSPRIKIFGARACGGFHLFSGDEGDFFLSAGGLHPASVLSSGTFGVAHWAA